jgi:hypothetical protein
MEPKRATSPISSAQVSAVMGPTPGTVLRRLIRSANRGSRCRGTDQGVFRVVGVKGIYQQQRFRVGN